jgi:hypothetical protein
MSRNTITKKPYCKVCHDAGKEYNNHWVKDLNGKTTCPTLLNTECRYCFKLGHTTKFCDVLAKQNKERERNERRRANAVESAAKPAAKEPKKSTNFFSNLAEDSDDNEEEVVRKEVREEYPTLCQPVIRTEAKTGWAAIAAKPKEEVKPVEAVEKKPEQPPKLMPIVKKSWAAIAAKPKEEVKLVEAVEKKPEQPPKLMPIVKKSWADWSDSEDEEEEDELPEVNFDDNYDPYQPYSFAVAPEEEDNTW